MFGFPWCMFYDSVRVSLNHHIIIIGFLINMQVLGHHPSIVGPLPGNWLVARITDLTQFVDTAMFVLELRFLWDCLS